MTVLDFIYNLFVATIVGGIIAPIIGGLILASKGKFNNLKGRGIFDIIVQLLLYSAICAGLGGLFFGIFEPGFFSFNIQTFDTSISAIDEFIRLRLFIFYAGDIFIRACLFTFCAVGIFLAMFFNIDFYDLLKRLNFKDMFSTKD